MTGDTTREQLIALAAQTTEGMSEDELRDAIKRIRGILTEGTQSLAIAGFALARMERNTHAEHYWVSAYEAARSPSNGWMVGWDPRIPDWATNWMEAK